MVAELVSVRDIGLDAACDKAVAALRGGEVVVLPTDTVYGVSADAFNPAATAQVFVAKQRKPDLALPVLVHSPKQLPGIVHAISDAAERVMAAFWPGPLTIVFETQPSLQWDLGVPTGTVAVRMPLDDVMLRVIRDTGPLAVTSANRSGEAAATSAEEAFDALAEGVFLIVDDGPRHDLAPSTIIDLSSHSPRILRTGAIDSDLVLAVARGQIAPLDAAAQFAQTQGDQGQDA
ncbi:MAG: L-threonylcarbamoyladenylate synthase [Nitriliruptoraceae bacterium]